MIPSRRATLYVALAFVAFSACGGPQPAVPTAPGSGAWRGAANAAVPDASPVTIKPTALSLVSAGSGGALTATVGEAKYTGAFSESSNCKGIATISPTSGKGPSFKVTVTGVKAGICAVTFADANKNKSVLNVTMTTTSLVLAGPLPSSNSAAVKVSPPGTTTNVPLSDCAKGCTIGVGIAPGTPSIGVSVSDSGKNVLATHAAGAETIKAGSDNQVKIDFVKIVAKLAWGTIPSAAAGTPFASAKAIALTAKDADGNAIVGTYASPIALTDSDATGGTGLKVNGGSASAGVTKSTDVVALAYTGLAISPATLGASTTGVTKQTATFTPALTGIKYTGPTKQGSNTPEVDLYSTDSNAADGYTAPFTATQTGWTGSTYKQKLTYVTAAINGQTNNCPGTGKASYAIAPASGSTSTAFTVTAASQAVAGECSLTITGGGGKQLVVILTFTTSHVGVNHRRINKK